MKIIKQLNINGVEAELIDDKIVQELFTPARAFLSFSSINLPKIGQLVELYCYPEQKQRGLFLGVVDAVVKTHDNTFQIMARQLASTLNRRININLRHCTPQQILDVISEKTGAQFKIGDNNTHWINKTVARFQHAGGGYMALDSILRLWDVKKGMWQQLENGVIYIGSIDDIYFSNKVIDLNSNWFANMTAKGGTLPIIPTLVPGVKVKLAGQIYYVNLIELEGHKMRINWQINPWSNILTGIL
jgi:hypothetical protein